MSGLLIDVQRTCGVVLAVVVLAALPVVAGERVTNGDFSNGSTGWTEWQERGTATRDFNSTATPAGGASPSLQISQTGSFNGGVYQQLALVAGQTYTVSVVSKDNGSTADAAWGEVLIGTQQPANGADYGGGCAQDGGCQNGQGCSPTGTILLKKWDTFSCAGWDGADTPCKQNCTTFTASAAGMYLILKCGQTGQSSHTVDVSFDNVSVDGPDPVTMRTLTVSANPGAGGTVDQPASAVTMHLDGTNVALSATPTIGYNFTGWTGTGVADIADPNALSTTITMNADYTAVANFELQPVANLCQDNRVVNPEFTNGNVGWSEWTERGDASFVYDETLLCPDGYNSYCARITKEGGFNGGIWQELNVVAGEQYTVGLLSRDVNSTVNAAWGEVLVGPSPPEDTLDYTTDSPPGTLTLIKWDTFDCDDWNGDESTACVFSTTTFTADASPIYFVLKNGQTQGATTDVSWDNVEVCGPAGCDAPTPTCEDYLVDLVGDSATVLPEDVAVNTTPGNGCTIADMKIKKEGEDTFSESVVFTCDDLGEHDVVVQVTQSDGKIAECSATVTVMDNTDPTLICPTVGNCVIEQGQQAILPNLLVSQGTPIADSVAEFSGVLGQDDWTYGQAPAGNCAGYTEFARSAYIEVFEIWAGVQFNDTPYVDANGGEPGFSDLAWPVRRWTSDYDGKITIAGNYSDLDTNCGDGATVRIFHNCTQIFEAANIPSTSTPYSVDALVATGDTIDFVIDAIANGQCDDTEFTAVVTVATPVGADLLANDNCALESVSQSPPAGLPIGLGQTLVTLTARDTSGNTTACQVNVNVVQAGGLSLVSAVSRRLHGGSGDFDLNLALAGTATVEPRANGSEPQMILSFSGDVEATDGAVGCGDEVVVTNGTCNGASIAGDQLIIDMTYNENACVSVALSGLRGAGGGDPLSGDSDVQVVAQTGNVDANTAVNILDLQAIKNALIQAVGPGNFKLDVNVSGGAINILDLQTTKNNLFKPASCP